MTITGAPQRLIPRWVPPTTATAGTTATAATTAPDASAIGETVAAGHAELTRPVAARLAARVRLAARRAGTGWEAALIAAHTSVLRALSGEQAFVSGYGELAEAQGEQEHEEPRTDNERRLAEAWAAVLTVPLATIGRGDSFFERGCTSLSAVRLIVQLERAFTLRDVHQHPVLAELAELLPERADAREPAALRESEKKRKCPHHVCDVAGDSRRVRCGPGGRPARRARTPRRRRVRPRRLGHRPP
ncbi:acyl carrier protein [Streptomyces sp. NPDC091287]|uniref:acyl carrier protein n=1 Tax=Streptomyces sp. NPDC091287 TaxID=3365988 RepID=UPI0037FE9812